MAVDATKKSSRLLQSRRYTLGTLADSQEAFTRVLDLGSVEIYAEESLIPSSGLPFSGSSQSGSYYTTSGTVSSTPTGQDLLKYYYRQKMTRGQESDGRQVWFFMDPPGAPGGVDSTGIQPGQQGNFISPKYSVPTLSSTNTENPGNPGYLVTVRLSTDLTSVVSPGKYTFDYKTGVLQWNTAGDTPSSGDVYISAYQYVGRTLASDRTSGYSGSFSGSFQGNGAGLTDIPASGIVGLNLTQIAATNTTASVSSGGTAFNLDRSGGSIFRVDSAGGYTALSDSTITGSLAISRDLIVQGTASFARIESVTGSAKIIGDAFIILNSNLPAERYAGILVEDSGSAAGQTGSLLYDAEEDHWFYDSVGGTYASGFIAGPRASRDNITWPSRYAVTRGDGSNHIVNSNIFSTASNVTINKGATGSLDGLEILGDLEVTGSLRVTAGATGSFSGSFEGDGAGLTNLPASSIVGLNLTQIADSTVSASVSSTGLNTFTVSSGGQALFEVGDQGGINVYNTSSIRDVSILGSATVRDNLTSETNLIAEGSTSLSGSNTLEGNNSFSGTTSTSGSTTLSGSVTILSDSQVTGSVNVLGSTNTVGTSTVDGDMVVTGSLTVSGSSTLTNIGPAEFTGSTGISGTLNTDGTSSVTGTSLVSGSTILSGSTDIEGPLNVDGLTNISSSITSNTPLSTATTVSTTTGNYILLVSESAWFKNHNIGIPKSNAWKDANLAGSYFENFDHNTNVSEVLRFLAGLLKDDAPAPEENTRIYNGVTQTPANTTEGTKPKGFVSFNHGDSTIQYLIDKGFAAVGEKLYYNVGTIYTNSNYQYTYTNLATGTYSVSSSNSDSTRLFGTGDLDFNVSVSASRFWKFFDNAAKTPTHTSSSATVTTNTTSNTTTSGFLRVSRAVISTANPAVIPNTYQDSKFSVTATNYNFTGSINFANSSSTGYYHLTASFGLATGSQTTYNLSPGNATKRNEIFYSPLTHVDTSITSNTPAGTFLTVQRLTATSRSLSGAPYLRTATYSTGITASNCFAPMYNESADIAEITVSGTGISQTGNTSATIDTADGTYDTSNVFYDAGGNLQSIGTIPTSSDEVRLSTTITANPSNGATNFVDKTTLNSATFTVTGTGYNRKNNSNELDEETPEYHTAGTFGQPASSGSLAYYGRDDGFDNSSATFTKGTLASEYFNGETYRRNIDDDVLDFDLPGNTIWDSGSALGVKDLQVIPGELTDPGASTGYWYPNNYGNTTKFYIREVQYASGGALANLTVDLGVTLDKWSSNSDGWAVALVLENQKATGGGNGKLFAYEPGAASATSVTGVSTGNQNPFTRTVDIGYMPTANVGTYGKQAAFALSGQAVGNGDRIFIILRLINSTYGTQSIPTTFTITGG